MEQIWTVMRYCQLLSWVVGKGSLFIVEVPSGPSVSLADGGVVVSIIIVVYICVH